MLRIAIVGSGASAVSIVEAALSINSKIEIDLFDPWNQLPQKWSSTPEHNPLQLAKKSRFGSVAMYDYPRKYIDYKDALHVPLSSTIGGLTTVWGANSTIPKVEDINAHTPAFARESVEWVTKYASITDLSSIEDSGEFFISQRLRKSLNATGEDSKTQIIPASLSINPTSCTKKGGCLSGCEATAIFSAEKEILRLVRSGKVNLHKAYVQKIVRPKNGKFSLVLEYEDSKRTSDPVYDKVFIACGAIASCALLQRSSLIPNVVELRDTQVFYSAFFIKGRNNAARENFELAQLFIRKSNIFHISIYEFSNQFISRAKLILGNLVCLIPNRFWEHIIAGIGFISSADSGRLQIEYRDSKSYVTEMTNETSGKRIKEVLMSIKKTLARRGIYLLPFSTQIANVGASYHIGAVEVNGIGIFHESGKISGQSNLELYVLDSSSLLQLPVGPITTTVMAAAYGRAKEALTVE